MMAPKSKLHWNCGNVATKNRGLSPGEPAPTPLDLGTWAASSLGPARDYHLHTNFTDGLGSVEEMVQAAKGKGLANILFSEHIRAGSTYFFDFARQVQNLSQHDLGIFLGVETKVLDEDGRLDCPAEAAVACDAIIGSVHRPPPDDQGRPRQWSDLEAEAALDLEYRLAMAIVTKSRANILGHPMGMAISKFGLRPIDHLAELAKACRRLGKAFELNPRYCLDPEEMIRLVEDSACLVSLGSDAHRASDVGSAWLVFTRTEE